MSQSERLKGKVKFFNCQKGSSLNIYLYIGYGFILPFGLDDLSNMFKDGQKELEGIDVFIRPHIKCLYIIQQ